MRKRVSIFLHDYWLIISLSIAFSIAYSILSIIRHDHFQSGGFDLGIYDQAVWQYSKLLYPFNTIKMKMILADHLTLTLPLLSPLYLLWSDVRVLLAFQAVMVSISSYPLYRYILLRGLSNIEALLLSFLYISFYGIQFAVFSDFHPAMLGVALLPWLLLFWEKKQWYWFSLAALLLLLTQENMGITLLGLSFIWFFQRKNRKRAVFMGIIGLVYTLAAFAAMSYMSVPEYIPELPRSAVEYVVRLFDSEEKRQVWLYSFSWYSFLPLFYPPALLAVLADISQYFATGQKYARMWSPFMHHRAILSVFLTAGTVEILCFLKNKKINTRHIVIAIVLIALFQQYYFHFALNKLAKRSFWQRDTWIKDNYIALSSIPEDASVAAQQSLAPHLSHREHIYLIYPKKKDYIDRESPCEDTSCWWLDFAGEPEYLIVDTHPGVWLTMTLEKRENVIKALDTMKRVKAITLVSSSHDAKVFAVDNNVIEKYR